MVDLKKTYYFIICLAALIFLFWGAVDLTSSTVGLLFNKGGAAALEPLPGSAGEQLLDTYYQKKALVDRFWDSAARVILAGAVFIYCRRRADGEGA